MKKILISIIVFVAAVTIAQEQVAPAESVEPVGVPARLEVSNGKVVKVLLQQAVGGNISFRVFQSDKDITVEQSQIKSLTFYPKYEETIVQQQFNNGDYAGVISAIEPMIEPFLAYMAISNNLQPALCMLMDAYRESGDFSNVRKSAEILLTTGNSDMVLKGQVNTALAALDAGDVDSAEALRSALASEAAGLYLKACIQRAQQQPTVAIQTATDVIAKHGNDMDWLPPSELLCAQLYLDMAMTNSADSTARQVENLYAGMHIAKDAAKLRSRIVRTTDETK